VARIALKHTDGFKLFETYMQEKLSPTTIDKHRNNWNSFFSWLGEDTPETNLREVRRKNIDRYLKLMAREEIKQRNGGSFAPRTVYQRLETLKYVFGFLFNEGYLKSDPAINVEMPRFKPNINFFLFEGKIENKEVFIFAENMVQAFDLFREAFQEKYDPDLLILRKRCKASDIIVTDL
jgi:site-specific recombinase XerD